MYYNKCHNAIKDNATNQNCKELLKLIKEAEKSNLLFLYAYNRKFPSTLKEKEKNIKYIEIVDPILDKKFNIFACVIKREDGSNLLLDRLPEFIKFDIKDFKLYNFRINKLYDMAEKIKKFNLDNLPCID